MQPAAGDRGVDLVDPSPVTRKDHIVPRPPMANQWRHPLGLLVGEVPGMKAPGVVSPQPGILFDECDPCVGPPRPQGERDQAALQPTSYQDVIETGHLRGSGIG